MKTTEIVLLLVVVLLVACIVWRAPTTIVVLVPLDNEKDQPTVTSTTVPEPSPKFHGFALA